MQRATLGTGQVCVKLLQSLQTHMFTYLGSAVQSLISTNPLLAMLPSYPESWCMHAWSVRLTVFRNRNTWNTSWKSLVFAEIHIKIVKHLLKCYYFKHYFYHPCSFETRQTYRSNHHSTLFLFRNRVNRTCPKLEHLCSSGHLIL